MNTWAKDLNPTYQPMTDVQVVLMMSGCLMEEDAEFPLPPSVEDQFLIKVLDKRIEVFKLPISFSEAAKVAVLALVDRPGSIVVLLIDCLNAYEGKTVTANMLTELYPEGFYAEETLMRYIDKHIKVEKSKQVKWAQIY